MTLLLGVDTGGTYTDAVLLRDEEEVVASAKALTTRHDLAEGIGEAIRAVLSASGVSAAEVSMASLSTTLATNALVEGQGGRVALIYIGFRERDLEAHGLAAVLKGDPVLVCPGGHDHAGAAAASLDEAQICDFLDVHGPHVSGFAVAAQFATRNPAHEARVAALIAERTGKPVSSSHQLSAKLNGPKRAMTALLNARLIGLIDQLIGRAESILTDFGIEAPLMVVRGDGALISAAQARERPIETILSGPAASLVGARWLTGISDALVSDIGGTTTDVALLRDGKPSIDPAGARVGTWRTMVEAVAMRTTGLGGDSEVHVEIEGLKGGLRLGPARAVPVSLLSAEAPDVVHQALDAQLRRSVPGEHDGRFVRGLAGQNSEGLGGREAGLLERIGTNVLPVGDVLRSRIELGALRRLRERGLVQISSVTPSDACHVLGSLREWDAVAAEKALVLMARRRTGDGRMLASSATGLAEKIVQRLTLQTGHALLEAAISEEQFDQPADRLARHELMTRGLENHRGILRIDTGLNIPVVGLGASAGTYYPAVGERLRTEVILPEYTAVANAIGAVTGRITMRESGTITAPGEGQFRVHFDTGPVDFSDQQQALNALEEWLTAQTSRRAGAAGAEGIRIVVNRDIRTVDVEARHVFVEAHVQVEATGRPRVAKD